MTEERFIELMRKDNCSSWEGDNAYLGLRIIAKYTDKIVQGANHDILYSEDISKLIEKGITEEEVLELRKLNWMVEDNTYLACFV